MSTDSEIILRSRTNSAQFGEIYDRHAADIGRYLARRIGADAAEDVLAETFLTAFRKRASFDSQWESARPWLFGIATRLMRRHRRLEAVQWRASQSAEHEEPLTEVAQAQTEERLDAAARVRALQPALAALAPRDRDVLLLYAWEDLTYEDIGRALDIPTGTVRSRLNRARRQLANAIPVGHLTHQTGARA